MTPIPEVKDPTRSMDCYEVHHRTDRIRMMEQATALVRAMVDRTIGNGESFNVKTISEPEDQCYCAALKFLKTQFELGPNMLILSRVSIEREAAEHNGGDA